MKAKNVTLVCKSKMRHFLAHVADERVRDIIQQNAIITGGAIASMLRGEPVVDFDIYFRTKEATYAVAQHFVKQFVENPPPRFKDDKKQIEVFVESLEDRCPRDHQVCWRGVGVWACCGVPIL